MVENYINKYNTMHAENGKMKYYPFCGIVTYDLKKKLRQFAKSNATCQTTKAKT